MRIYVEFRVSKNGNTYPVLCADLGYRVALLTFDRLTICDLLNCSPAELSQYNVGDIVDVVFEK